jgi:hypothetical protein
MPIPYYHPKAAPPGMFQDQIFPASKANLLSNILAHYITPVMKVGVSRPLDAEGKACLAFLMFLASEKRPTIRSLAAQPQSEVWRSICSSHAFESS